MTAQSVRNFNRGIRPQCTSHPRPPYWRSAARESACRRRQPLSPDVQRRLCLPPCRRAAGLAALGLRCPPSPPLFRQPVPAAPNRSRKRVRIPSAVSLIVFEASALAAGVQVPRRIARLGAAPRNNYVVRRPISATHRSPARLPLPSLSPPGGNLRALGGPMAAGQHRVPSWHVVCNDVPSMGCRIAAEDDDHPAGSRRPQQGSRVRTHSIMAFR